MRTNINNFVLCGMEMALAGMISCTIIRNKSSHKTSAWLTLMVSKPSIPYLLQGFAI